MDHNNVLPILVSINTKFLNCLQPEWSKYVNMVHHNQTGDTVSYDVLYDSLVQFEPHVLASKGKKAAKNHDPLALIVHSNSFLSQSHANSSYLPQPYYVTHPSSVKFSTPTNNRLRTSSNTRNQDVVQDGRVDIQTKNTGYEGNGNKNAGRQNRNQAFNAGNGNDDNNQIVQRVPRTEEQMLLAMKDEAGSILKNEENDFLLDNSYGEETMEELTTTVMFIDSNIISDDPYVENNGGTSDHDSNAHDEYHAIQIVLKEKDKIQCEFFKIGNEMIIIQHETQLAIKAFKERENWYLKDIIDLEEKLSSHDQNVYKMGQSIQTIHMLGKKQNKVYDPFLKAGLSYKNPERLKKAIAAQPKMYDGERLHSTKLTIDSSDLEETLEDVEESLLKMRNKMVKINYGKLNALYEILVPQQEFSIEQTYFSISSTSNNGSESKEVTSDLPIPKMPKESKLLKMFDTMGVAINGLRTRIDKTLLEDIEQRWMSDSQNLLREFYETNVISMSASLLKNLKELKEELIEEVQEMLNTFESME
ncbi:hypothetical protein Tco_0600791 [Tanacetum coccineum]